MKVVILAGGYGTRISEESQFKPKPMIEIGSKPILWHIMKEYSYYGFNDFIICAGYKQHIIKEWFANYFLHNSDMPFLRGIVAELGFKRKDITYEQQKRRAGKTSFNFYRLYDAAMLSFTSYTKIGMRIATIMGFIISFVSILIALVYLVLKLINWDSFPMGNAPILIGVFILGGIQLFFIGLLGEYIMSINTRVMNRPLVIEEKRINFYDDKINMDI